MRNHTLAQICGIGLLAGCAVSRVPAAVGPIETVSLTEATAGSTTLDALTAAAVRNATAHCAARAQTFELFEVRDGAPETVSYTDTGLAVAALQAEAARTRLTVHVRFRCRRSAG